MTVDSYADEWVPDKPLTREKQFNTLTSALKRKHHLFMHGSKGIGKTFTAKFFQTRNPEQVELIPMYSRLPESIGLFLGLKDGWRRRVPEMKALFLEKLTQKKCVIFDDIQQVQRRLDLFHFLKDLHEHLKDSNPSLSVVLISQEPSHQFFKQTPTKRGKASKDSVESRYAFTGLPIPPLDSAEITQVLVQRVNAKFNVNIPATAYKALSFFGDNTVRLGSDLRLALRLLRSLDEHADGTLSNYSMTKAEEVWRGEKTRYATGQLLSLPAHQAALVTVIAPVTEKISAKDAYNKYVEFVTGHEGNPLDYRQVLRHMDELSSLGYLIIYRSTPPFGNMIKLEPSLNPENLIAASKEIHWNAMLLGAR